MLLPINGRLREQSDISVTDSVAVASNGQTFFLAGGCLRWTSWSKLYDFPRRGSFGFDGRTRPVDHHKVTTKLPLVTVPFAGGGGVSIVPISQGTGIHPGSVSLMVPPVPETVWWENSRDAFNAFSDQFPEEMSLGNFLLELDDLAAILPKLERTLRKTLAGHFLNLSFNVKPLLKDLSALFSMCASVSSRIDFLRRTRGKPRRINHRKRWTMDAPANVVWDQPPYYGPGGNILEFSFSPISCEYVAGAYLLQNLTHLDDFYGLLRAYMGKTGLNNPLKVVWNAIPFSFVLDWFIPVSGHLARFKIQGADGQWDLIDPTCSITQSCEIVVVQVNHFTGDRTALGRITSRRYTRLVGLPVPLAFLPEISALNLNQLALLLAMST